MRLFTGLWLALGLALMGVPAFPDAPRPLAAAMEAKRADNWDRALMLGARAGPVGRDLIEWHRLRAGRGDAAAVEAFLATRPDWPGLSWLREQSEDAVAEAGPATVLAFFDGTVPQTGRGALAYAWALEAEGQVDAAHAAIALAWRTLELDEDEQSALLDAYGDVLRDHHAARLDMILWEGWGDNARAMLPLVGDDLKALAAARLALHKNRDGVDALIAAVPDGLSNDAGLAWERFMWRARKGRRDSAMDLLLERSKSPELLGEPARWASWRRSYARAEMRDGNISRAYQMASQHFLTEGTSYSDLEWLSGYLALTYLNDPELALTHFERFRRAVFTPISLGRAGYWLGRTYEAMGDTEAATQAYASAAAWQTSFYGLLAAEKIGQPFDASLAGTERTEWQNSPMTQDSRFEAALMLIASGERNLAERFLRALADNGPIEWLPALGWAMVDLDAPHLAVIVGKRAARRGIVVPAAYYPLHPLAEGAQTLPPAFSLSIARRESEFDPSVVSSAGARGLMQVMPATGQDAAKLLGISYDGPRLLSDPVYNARLAKAYIGEMAQRYGGNLILVSIAYNAGPGRANRWRDAYGDPRRLQGTEAVVDWIEHIPFRETRNYVMRVAESLPIYRARLGQDPLPEPLSEELVGSSILPLSP